MSELQHTLKDMVGRLFEEVLTTGNQQQNPQQSATAQWQLIEDFGLPDLLLPEQHNGFNGNWSDAGLVFHLTGSHALPLPVGETIIARKFLYEAAQVNTSLSLSLPSGPIAIAHCDDATLSTTNNNNQRLFSGNLQSVNQAQAVLVSGTDNNEHFIALLNPADAISVESATGLTGERRNDMTFEKATISQLYSPPSALSLFDAGALLRSAQIAGALETALQLSIDYVNERQQFGRAIARFQVIQHDLARLAEYSAAVDCACQTALRAADIGDAAFEIAAARLQANRVIPGSTSIAHQVHGAIGFTEEHRLHHFTQSLLCWRSEFGNDRFWAHRLGTLVLAAPTASLWELLTQRSDAIAGARSASQAVQHNTNAADSA